MSATLPALTAIEPAVLIAGDGLKGAPLVPTDAGVIKGAPLVPAVPTGSAPTKGGTPKENPRGFAVRPALKG